MREKWFNLAPAAIGAVEDALKSRKDGRLGFQLLATIGAIPSPEETQLLTTPPLEPEETLDKKVMMYMVEATIERAHIYGMEMPEFDKLLNRVNCRINIDTGKIEPIKKRSPRLEKW